MALTPVNYTPHVWANGEEGGTPINATRLNEIEAGIYDGSLSINEIVEYLQTEVSITNDELYNGTYEGRNIAEIPEIQDELDQYGSIPAFLQARAQNLDSRYLRVGDWCYVNNTYMGDDWKYAIYAFWPYLNTGEKDDSYPGHIMMGPLDTAFVTTTQWSSGSSGNNNGTSSQPCPYAGSEIHKFELETILPTFPTAWQNVMMETELLLEQRYSSSGKLTDSSGRSYINAGKIWSLSELEVEGMFKSGNSTYVQGFDCQIPFFRVTRNRIFFNQAGERVNWWLRTPCGTNTTSACCVHHCGFGSSSNTTNSNRVVPCFNVG